MKILSFAFRVYLLKGSMWFLLLLQWVWQRSVRKASQRGPRAGGGGGEEAGVAVRGGRGAGKGSPISVL